MVDLEWKTCLSSYFQLFDRRRLSLGNEETALLLIFLRKGIERILVIIGVAITLLSVVGKVFCKILNLTIDWCNV